LKVLRGNISFEVENKDLFNMSFDMGSEEFGWGDFIYQILNGASWGLFSAISNAFSHNDIRCQVERRINSINSDFDPEPYLNTVFERKDCIIDLVKKSYIDELITPLLEQIQEARSKREEREVNLQKAQTRLSELEEAIKRLDRQIEEMAILAKSVS
jgi:hypothetical protein